MTRTNWSLKLKGRQQTGVGARRMWRKAPERLPRFCLVHLLHFLKFPQTSLNRPSPDDRPGRHIPQKASIIYQYFKPQFTSKLQTVCNYLLSAAPSTQQPCTMGPAGWMSRPAACPRWWPGAVADRRCTPPRASAFSLSTPVSVRNESMAPPGGV